MRIVVGISGGVDSAFAAALLQERGWDVVGCFLKVVVPGAPCAWESDLPMAHRVAAHLNIPLVVKDVSAEYEREVLGPMVAAYRAGETPNPDTMCNRWVKFDALIAVAREAGAERIATGHYARLRLNTNPRMDTNATNFSSSRWEGEREGVGYVELHRGLDHSKDQSYFLASLTQEQLAFCEFPLGEWRKEDVRAEAKRRGFPNWDRESTSGICFLGHMDLASFLTAKSTFSPSRGEGEQEGVGPITSDGATVVTTTGEVLGTISNSAALTIGQRAPIAGQPAPRYVVAVCSTPGVEQSRRVIVSASPDDPARFTNVVHAVDPHWIGGPSPVFSPPLAEGEREGVRGGSRGWGTLHCSARIRHRQEPQPCTLRFSPSLGEGEFEGVGVTAEFATPLTGVAPGQAVVFSDGDRILGSATIVHL